MIAHVQRHSDKATSKCKRLKFKTAGNHRLQLPWAFPGSRAPGGGHRPRSAAGTRGAVTNPARAQANFTAVAHLYHANSNRSSVAWEAGLRR